MMNKTYDRVRMKMAVAVVALGLAGCKEPVNVSGSYSTPAQTVSGDVNVATNGVSVSGNVNVKN
jgi:hypothetical protein